MVPSYEHLAVLVIIVGWPWYVQAGQTHGMVNRGIMPQRDPIGECKGGSLRKRNGERQRTWATWLAQLMN